MHYFFHYSITHETFSQWTIFPRHYSPNFSVTTPSFLQLRVDQEKGRPDTCSLTHFRIDTSYRPNLAAHSVVSCIVCGGRQSIHTTAVQLPLVRAASGSSSLQGPYSHREAYITFNWRHRGLLVRQLNFKKCSELGLRMEETEYGQSSCVLPSGMSLQQGSRPVRQV
jgi:hypothetical protein